MSILLLYKRVIFSGCTKTGLPERTCGARRKFDNENGSGYGFYRFRNCLIGQINHPRVVCQALSSTTTSTTSTTSTTATAIILAIAASTTTTTTAIIHRCPVTTSPPSPPSAGHRPPSVSTTEKREVTSKEGDGKQEEEEEGGMRGGHIERRRRCEGPEGGRGAGEEVGEEREVEMQHEGVEVGGDDEHATRQQGGGWQGQGRGLEGGETHAEDGREANTRAGRRATRSGMRKKRQRERGQARGEEKRGEAKTRALQPWFSSSSFSIFSFLFIIIKQGEETSPFFSSI
ncbi:hypothetical protein D9613_011579 [Agrocybe pediades]|uniref:Uncharacterized protein n=1 Tax=Agrocybe pediades TaxID=84607 RepID=A0A8H4VQ42_9AGAR|nr:hypothetical protein D9613_011579 [Agrocybe pediades]